MLKKALNYIIYLKWDKLSKSKQTLVFWSHLTELLGIWHRSSISIFLVVRPHFHAGCHNTTDQAALGLVFRFTKQQQQFTEAHSFELSTQLEQRPLALWSLGVPLVSMLLNNHLPSIFLLLYSCCSSLDIFLCNVSSPCDCESEYPSSDD